MLTDKPLYLLLSLSDPCRTLETQCYKIRSKWKTKGPVFCILLYPYSNILQQHKMTHCNLKAAHPAVHVPCCSQVSPLRYMYDAVMPGSCRGRRECRQHTSDTKCQLLHKSKAKFHFHFRL